MKWVLYGLIVINLGYFTWQFQQFEPPVALPSTAEPEMIGHGLLLLSEVDAGELIERKAPLPPPVENALPDGPATPPEAAEAESGEGVCYRVGPLDPGEDMEAMQQWLEARGADVVLRERERREVSSYWVYLPPSPTRAVALERADALRQDGVEDIYVIPGGDMGNAISLGVYSRRNSLERRLAGLREKGYDPFVDPRYHTKTASWLDTAFPPDGVLPEEAFAETFPGAEFSERTCS